LKCTSCSGTGEKLADKYVNCLGELDYPGKYCSRCKGSCSWATTVYYKSGVKCLDCRGNGLIYCSECNGKPKVHRYKCESCEGIGYKKFVVCNYCKGELPKKNELSAEMNAFIFGKCNMCEGSGKLSRPLSY
jgi:DnaJ-class molecular chaperone